MQHPSLALEAGGGVALRYEVRTVWVGASSLAVVPGMVEREGWTAVVGLAVSLAGSGHPLSQQCSSFLQRVLLPHHPQ